MFRPSGKQTRRPRTSSSEEFALGCRAFAGEVAARDALIESHVGLAYHLANRWKKYPGIEIDDLRQEALLTLCICARRFDPVRYPGVRLSTFAGACIVGRLATYCAKHRRRELTNFDMDQIVDPTSLPASFEERDADNIWTAVEKLGRGERELLELHFGLDGRERLTFQEIGDRLALSKQAIHQKVSSTVAKLATALRKCA